MNVREPFSTWLACSGFNCSVDSESQTLILSVFCVSYCGCTDVCWVSVAVQLCDSVQPITHTHTQSASTHCGQRLPSWQHSDSLVAPVMSTRLLRLGEKPCISIKWAFQAKHIYFLPAIKSGPVVLRVSRRVFSLLTQLQIPHMKISQA